MPEPGSFSFFPWLRRGVATEISRAEGDAVPAGGDPARVDVPVSITLNDTQTITVPLGLVGPGEIAAVDRDSIIRVYPIPGAFDAESNYFPLLEFDQADFPWRYTPARAGSTDRLTPWICLVVLRDDEIAGLIEPAASSGLPILSVEDADLLPPWAQLWAWAHVQLSGTRNPSPAELKTLVETEPHRVISRLLCARRLEPNTQYTAFLVPTFERGRVAGCGETVPPQLDALAPAWGAHGAVRLPVYFRWRFGTGAAGDFEFLVRQLAARALPPTIGKRAMDVSAPGGGLPPASADPLYVEGALAAIGMERTTWPQTGDQAFLTDLEALLNLPSDRLADVNRDRAVVPPLYGRWHARAERLDHGSEPHWFNDLNQDPRERVAAGAGTLVVQQQQRQLMAGAWRQVQGIREANERLRLTQLARELAVSLYRRHITPGTADRVLQLGSPVLSRIMASPTTLHARLLASPVLPGMLESQFRRVTRPRGPIGRRQDRARTREWTGFSRINSGALRGPGPAATSASLVTPESAPPDLPQWAADDAMVRLRLQRKWLPVAAFLLLGLAVVLAIAAGTLAALAAGVTGAGAFVASRRAANRIRQAERAGALAHGSLTAAQLERAPIPRGFRPAESAPDTPAPPRPVGAARGGDDAAARAFRSAAADMLGRLSDPIETPPPLEAVRMSEVRGKIVAALDPRLTVVAGMRTRFDAPGIVRQPTADPAEPVMAAPLFPQPMYVPLAALSQDWLLPGIEQVPPNTVTTVLTNQRFIEAYMTGLNHEMVRELQWNEYPTDMRGTCFRQFWDSAGASGAPDAWPDITPHHEWSGGSRLGEHPARPAPAGQPHLVLLVRGEVFRRYPNTQVYAVKARAGTAVEHELGDEELFPAFSGRVAPDVTFFGFELTVEEARGAAGGDPAAQGWFFVLQEQPSEPRFGMDVADAPGGRPATWSDLSWGHLASSDGELAAIRYVDLAAALPDTSEAGTAGGARWRVSDGARASDLALITLQQPMRVAVHGSDMVPTPGEP